MNDHGPVHQKLLSRRSVLEMLADMEMEPGATWKMRLLKSQEWLEGQESALWDWLPSSAIESGSGLALFTRTVAPAEPEPLLALAPPVPLLQAGEFTKFSELEELLKRRLTVAILLLRLGHYTFGIAEDETLVVHKTGGRYVKNRQRKGGQSAARFVRNREKAIQELFDQVAEVARSRVEAYERHIDWLAFGGDRNVILQFMKRLKLPNSLAERVSPWRIPVERPGLNELERAVTSAWSSRVWERPGD